MNSRHFDEFVSALGRSSPRRRVLSALGVATLGGLAGRGEVAAKRVQRQPAAGHVSAAMGSPTAGVCGGTCGAYCDRRTAAILCDPNNPLCACFRSVTGTIHCASGDRQCPPAGSGDECQRDADCGPNAICATTAGGICCNADDQAQVNFCLTLCPTGGTPESSRKATTGHAKGSLLGLRDQLLRP